MKKRVLLTGIIAGLLPIITASAIEWQKKESSKEDSSSVKKVPSRAPMSKVDNPAKASSEGEEYLVVGKSIFNQEGANVYPDGGYSVAYPCYVNFDDQSGKVTFDGLFREEATSGLKPAVLDWDPSLGMIHADTPDNFLEKSDCVYLGDFDEDMIYALQAGEIYGIGYWNSLKELKMEVSEDRSLITPASAYACRLFIYDEYDKEYMASRSYDEVMFDARLYKRTDGISAISSASVIDFGESFVGETVTKSFSIVNPGKEEGDFVVSISNPDFVVNMPTGSLLPGECTVLEVSFTPSEVGICEAELVVMSDDTECSVHLQGSGVNIPDYSKIVKEGGDLMTFAASNQYPFELSNDYGDSPVAISTNANVAKSSSWFETAFEVPADSRGVFQYTGYFYPRWASYDVFNVYVDGELAYTSDTSRQYKGDLKEEFQLLPGDHTVRFEYEKGAIFNSPEVEMGEDYAYISSISLTITPYLAQSASLNKDSYDFGTLYLRDSYVNAASEGNIIIRNNGYETLLIKSVEESDNFEIIAPKSILPDQTAYLTIDFTAKEIKQYDETLTIFTSAGDLTLHLKANVEEFPDYSQIVKEGEFWFQGGRHPFVIENGVAVNPQLPNDGEEVISEFTAVYSVPEGKYGLLTWDGHADCGDGDEGMIMFDADAYSIIDYIGNVDAGNYSAKATYCWVKPGEHSISFGYIHSGHSEYDGSNTLKISNLSLVLIDEMPPMVLWEPTPIVFKPLYPGTMDFHLLSLYNLDYDNEENIAVTAVDIPDNFYCEFNASSFSSIPVYATARLTIAAAPTTAGKFEGEFVLHTTRGDVSIPVVCEGKDDSHLIFHEEFENEDLPGWTIIDKNGDEKTWGFGSDKLSNTGKGCLTFNSNFLKMDAEDYIVSPEITIPEGKQISFTIVHIQKMIPFKTIRY